MTDLFKLKVGFSDGTELEVSDVENTYENLVGRFIRVEAGETEWIFFFDNIKYLVWHPQSLNGSARKSE